MKRRLALSLALAVAAAPLLAVAADPAPSAPAAVVDCLWAATPASFRQSFIGSVDADHFDKLVDAYTPTDEQLVAMADRCRLTGSADQPAYETAALAIMSKARWIWAQARLTSVYKLAPAQLEDAWRQVSPEDRSVISRFMQTLDPDLFDKINGPLNSFTAALHATDPDEVATVTAYLYGRAQVEGLQGGGSK